MRAERLSDAWIALQFGLTKFSALSFQLFAQFEQPRTSAGFYRAERRCQARGGGLSELAQRGFLLPAVACLLLRCGL